MSTPKRVPKIKRPFAVFDIEEPEKNNSLARSAAVRAAKRNSKGSKPKGRREVGW